MTKTSTSGFTYLARDGNRYPVIEAPFDMDITIYKAARKKAVAGDPRECRVARDACKNKNIVEMLRWFWWRCLRANARTGWQASLCLSL